MGLILAGILLGVLIFGLVLLYLSCSKSPDETIGVAAVILAIVVVVSGFFAGITKPVSGYGETKVHSAIELVSLRDDTASNGTGRLFYVSVSGTNTYTYYVEVDSPYISDSQKAYKSNTICNCNVTIIEDDSYTKAKLVTYVKYGKKTFWTFAVGAKQYEYVFYVPTGTIARDVSLG